MSITDEILRASLVRGCQITLCHCVNGCGIFSLADNYFVYNFVDVWICQVFSKSVVLGMKCCRAIIPVTERRTWLMLSVVRQCIDRSSCLNFAHVGFGRCPRPCGYARRCTMSMLSTGVLLWISSLIFVSPWVGNVGGTWIICMETQRCYILTV